jgi:hypothetical protein
MRMLFAAARSDANGTEPTSQHVGFSVAYGGRPDVPQTGQTDVIDPSATSASISYCSS